MCFPLAGMCLKPSLMVLNPCSAYTTLFFISSVLFLLSKLSWSFRCSTNWRRRIVARHLRKCVAGFSDALGSQHWDWNEGGSRGSVCVCVVWPENSLRREGGDFERDRFFVHEFYFAVSIKVRNYTIWFQLYVESKKTHEQTEQK